MSKSTALQAMKKDLHISYGQVFNYLNCSLKYKFQNVEAKSPERLSIALPFGSAVHSAAEVYYRSIKDQEVIAPLSELETVFTEYLSHQLDSATVPVIYKKETPDKDSAIEMGLKLLKVFYDSVNLTEMQVVDVELPLSATLFTETGELTDFKLIGVIDLLLMTEAGELIIVDNKTAVQKKSHQTVDDDLQMTAYSYLVAANKYVFPSAPTLCRFDVLRKLKKPTFEQYHTIRTAENRKRFSKITTAVLAGIENRIFIPSKSWMCTDCGYIDACNAW